MATTWRRPQAQLRRTAVRRIHHADPERIRNLDFDRENGHTPRWCPEEQVNILVGPERICPACRSQAPFG